jgi:serine protease DegS
VDLVRGVVEEIKKNGRVIRGWVGLKPDELSRAESLAMGLDPNFGILLSFIYDDGPAAAAGLLQGDVILAIDNETIRSPQQALLLVARLNPGEQVEIEGWRDGQRFRATLTVAERPELARTN